MSVPVSDQDRARELYVSSPGVRVGSLQGLVFTVDDVRATCEELVARGVPFDFPPRERPGGLQAVLRDPDANGFMIAGRRG